MHSPAGRASPTRFGDMVFGLKALCLQARRKVVDLRGGPRRWPCEPDIEPQHILASVTSPLWMEESLSERALQRGKVHNLRVAVRQLNGCVIPANEEFSFWKQVGRAARRRGFVVGRELREGCLTPGVGGGLCQLSNALYALALQADCLITERHAHSRIVPGSAAAAGEDATVAWNYIDLRFRPRQSMQIQIILTDTMLRAQLLTRDSVMPALSSAAARPSLLLKASAIGQIPKSCTSCGVADCHRSTSTRAATIGRANSVPDNGRRAWMVDEYWPEFQLYMDSSEVQEDLLLVPIDGRRYRMGRYRWDSGRFTGDESAAAQTLARSYRSRRLAGYGAARLSAELRSADLLARTYSRRLGPDVTRLVVMQPFLPYLWREGVLGGRQFDVLMTRQPLLRMHALLDVAAARWPDRTTLTEFRAPVAVAKAEALALARAERIITPHADIARQFAGRAVLLNWADPGGQAATGGTSILFPGPCAARKGAYEVREAARIQGAEVVLPGSELEGPGFWEGVQVHRTQAGETGWTSRVGVVVQPALVEDRPRALLRALSAGIPVIATGACGLGARAGVTEMAFGDSAALADAIARVRLR